MASTRSAGAIRLLDSQIISFIYDLFFIVFSFSAPSVPTGIHFLFLFFSIISLAGVWNRTRSPKSRPRPSPLTRNSSACEYAQWPLNVFICFFLLTAIYEGRRVKPSTFPFKFHSFLFESLKCGDWVAVEPRSCGRCCSGGENNSRIESVDGQEVACSIIRGRQITSAGPDEVWV